MLPLLFDIPAGDDYILRTDLLKNNETFGFDVNSPRLYRSDENLDYPYNIGNALALRNSNFGQNFYYYFYDWYVSLEETYCISERIPVEAVVNNSTATAAPEDFYGCESYPNPSTGTIFLSFSADIHQVKPVRLSVTSLEGRIVRSFNQNQAGAIDLSDLGPGVYYLKGKVDNVSFYRKIILQ